MKGIASDARYSVQMCHCFKAQVVKKCIYGIFLCNGSITLNSPLFTHRISSVRADLGHIPVLTAMFVMSFWWCFSQCSPNNCCDLYTNMSACCFGDHCNEGHLKKSSDYGMYILVFLTYFSIFLVDFCWGSLKANF